MPAVTVACFLAAFSRPANADEIALVEDSDGSINQVVGAPNLYLARAACAFFNSHADIYDAIFVFTSIPQSFLTNTQQGWTVRQYQQGIGRPSFDQTASFCSGTGRLRMAVKMGDIAQLPANPDDRYTGIPFYPLSGIQLMGHEFGHHWLASVTFDKGDGLRHCLLRGFEPSGEPQQGSCDGYDPNNFNQHWSYYFNSGSLMYGSMIEDLGGGRFRLTYDGPKYSHLDQYLMGLRLPEEVEPLFLVDIGDVAGSGSSSIPIQPGQSAEIDGTRMDFTVEDIIRAEGERVPQLEPCHWKAALLIVHAAGNPPTSQQIDLVETYRQRWETFYPEVTDQRGSFDTTLDGRGTGTAGCPGQPTPDGGQPDGSGDGGPDGGADAEEDGGMDAGQDAGQDAGADVVVDAGEDAADDQAPDASQDASWDAGADLGGGDGGGDAQESGGGCGCSGSGQDGRLWFVLISCGLLFSVSFVRVLSRRNR